MAGLKVSWTKIALNQRNYIFEYWNKRNKSRNYARKLNSEIKSRTALLKQNPEMGIKTQFENTRAISLGHYNLLYKFNSPNIIITAFWDNRQDPEKLLNFLKRK